MTTGDRTVHARRGDTEIVRYNRAGKWYFEHPSGRKQVPLGSAVAEACRVLERGNGEVFFGRPGGQSFDRKVRGA